ncbi:flagellar biosynthesis protein FlhB [Thermosulfidibacter takaii ABI70S6]|uniref:Flagellar biosynthesis protein FlhB n=1 Tax=Thermosulfidibacter takaii (strain DSM 17441 / JCM 13301 / NBRC 103674 / ABI70S6) TaxID=1298851 RepID=A0A0S3QUT0_THET7|nr:EscU/YscU/HrcU family type III secretion system export apparatus switch protein [Thermosulfidibacter takaii]BAT72086.1 flagellar biosynthesis protein FlhB [Thermosulfidibacter takaii ABI70S6]
MKKAVALRYKLGQDEVPKVVAKGAGKLAEKILEIAKKHNIPIEKNAPLVNTLYRIELGSEIPPELYVAVAEVLAFVYSKRRT